MSHGSGQHIDLTARRRPSGSRRASIDLPPEIDLARLELDLLLALADREGFVREVTQYAVAAGGKRLRPILTLLCAGAGPAGLVGAPSAMPLAVAVELLHTATLVHDDVIDGSLERRGMPSVTARWGDRVAILAGNYLFSKSLTMVALLGRSDISAALGRVMQEICDAEILQLARAYDPSYTEAEYLGVARKKSALLIGECCRSGARLAGATDEVSEALYSYGECLGVAFQIADDLLDVSAHSGEIGKPTGQDIGLGLLTLPVIRAMPGSAELRMLVGRRLDDPGDRARALEIVREGDGLAYARQLAGHYVSRSIASLAPLPAGQPRDALASLAEFAVGRRN